MSDLISRKNAIDELTKMMRDCFPDSEEELDAVITTLKEVQSLNQTGTWLWDDEEDRCYCSECKNEDDLDIDGVYMMHDFCPNCGADMRRDEHVWCDDTNGREKNNIYDELRMFLEGHPISELIEILADAIESIEWEKAEDE